VNDVISDAAVEEVISDESASDWLKAALRTALERDPVVNTAAAGLGHPVGRHYLYPGGPGRVQQAGRRGRPKARGEESILGVCGRTRKAKHKRQRRRAQNTRPPPRRTHRLAS